MRCRSHKEAGQGGTGLNSNRQPRAMTSREAEPTPRGLYPFVVGPSPPGVSVSFLAEAEVPEPSLACA